MKKLLYACIAISALINSGCKKEYGNPNAPTDADVFNSAEGMTRVIVGIKQRFAVNASGVAALYSAISACGLTTKEVTVLNAGNADLAQIENGGSNLAPNNGVLTSLWSACNVVNGQAQKLIDNAANVSDANTGNSIQIYGHLYKAMSLGVMATFWEQVPLNTGENTGFSPRTEALNSAVKLLDDAITLLNNTTVPATFIAQVGSEIDIKNTLLALAARYYNMLGNNDNAIARAAAVDLSKKSVYFYNNVNPNPVFRSSLTTGNVYGILDDFGLSGALTPDPSDKRIDFYLTKNTANGSGFFMGDATAIPIYLPGEMMLIQAEANARKNSLSAAKNFLDQVLTKTAGQDAFGVGAELLAYSGTMDQASLLQEIYKNRCIELYMSGMKFEDSRRFSRPGPNDANAERTRNFYPYPQQERDGNANTPADPSI